MTHKYLHLYREILKIRLFEEKVMELFQEKMYGTTHLCTGQEAVAVGVCSALKPTDVVFSTHRGHGHYLAKGGKMTVLMAEMYGKNDGCCSGRSGSLHIIDKSIHHYGSHCIVGSGLPLAVGVAFAMKKKNEKNLAVCFMGDGATNQGNFHECLNMASLWKLPVLFVCENNFYGMSVPISKCSAQPELAQKAAPHGMPYASMDGMDAVAVYSASLSIAEDIRSGKGPFFLECNTYRFVGHSRNNPSIYRTQEEEEDWKRRDPLTIVKSHIASLQIKCDFSAEEAKIKEAVDEAVDFAEKSPLPEFKAGEEEVFAP